MKRAMVMLSCFVVAMIMCVGPWTAVAADDPQVKQERTDQKKGNKDEKQGDGEVDVRGGINRAYDGFKKETKKGKKNLNDLYERERSKSSAGEEKTK